MHTEHNTVLVRYCGQFDSLASTISWVPANAITTKHILHECRVDTAVRRCIVFAIYLQRATVSFYEHVLIPVLHTLNIR